MDTLSTKGATGLMAQTLNRFVDASDLDYFVRRGLLRFTASRGLRKQRTFSTSDVNALIDGITVGRIPWPDRDNRGSRASTNGSGFKLGEVVPVVPPAIAEPAVIKKSATFEITRDRRDKAIDTLLMLVAAGREITLLVELHPE